MTEAKRKTVLSTPRTLQERASRIATSPHPMFAIVDAPLRDFAAASWAQKIGALMAGTVTVWFSYAFLAFLPIAGLASVTDYFLGRYRARREFDAMGQPKFQAEVAQIGFAVKITTYTQLVMLWAGEQWAVAHVMDLIRDLGFQVPMWLVLMQGGWISTGLLVAYFFAEMDSVEAHKIALGRGPLWGWDILSKALRGLLGRASRVLSDSPVPPPTGGVPVPAEVQDEDRRRVEEADKVRRKPPPPASGSLNGTQN